MWKIIGVDNFSRDYVSDILIESNLTEEEANLKADRLNIAEDDNASWYYKAVPQEYKLYTFEP